jgi:hypothetical protein
MPGATRTTKKAEPKTNEDAPRADQMNLYQKLVKIRDEVGKIARKSEGQTGNQRYKYAPLEVVHDQLIPVLTKYGVSVIQPVFTTMSDSGDLSISVETIVTDADNTHDSVECQMSFFPNQGQKPMTVKEIGSNITYYRRYAICSLLNLAIEDDDDDGTAADDSQRQNSYPPPRQQQNRTPPPQTKTPPRKSPPQPQQNQAPSSPWFNREGVFTIIPKSIAQTGQGPTYTLWTCDLEFEGTEYRCNTLIEDVFTGLDEHNGFEVQVKVEKGPKGYYAITEFYGSPEVEMPNEEPPQ